jgi:DMSO/TMAO reductase YedYZ molybdopterin-dependent catalytic subunit
MDERQADERDDLAQDRAQDVAPAAPETAAASAAGAGAAEPGAADEPDGADEAPRMSMRYSRRRILILGGAFAAGVVGVAAGLRALGGSAASSVGGAISDQFGSFPVRSVDGAPDTPISQWTVKVDGLVDRPLTVDYALWTGLPRVAETVDFNCVEGWAVDNVRWAGVAPAVLLDKAGLRPEARYVVVHAESGKYLSTLPLDLMRDPKTMLADTLNGQPLPNKHGGPLRLVVPVQLGYKNVKWVSRLEVTDKVRTGYWENYGYPEDAPVVGG